MRQSAKQGRQFNSPSSPNGINFRTAPLVRAWSIAILLIGLTLLISTAARAMLIVSLEAMPMTIPADGRSHAQVLISVMDTSGAPVPDSTEVRLTASAGDITPVVYTVGGHANAIITSTTSPQLAIITATAQGASGMTQVEFSSSAEGQAAVSVARAIRITATGLAYCVDQDTIIASGGMTMDYRGLTIEAASAQVNQAIGQIRMQGNVKITKGNQTVTADELSCDLHSDLIYLRNIGDKQNVRIFEADNLKELKADPKLTSSIDFTPLLNVTSKSWITCERLVLIPGQKILFYRASIFVGDAKVVTVPYYAYNYDSRQSIFSQVRYSTLNGAVVDVPYYYSVSDSQNGAVRFRYAAQGTDNGTYANPAKGASIGLEEDYSLGPSSQGRAYIDSLAGGSQAYETSDHFDLKGGELMDVAARYQPSSSYAQDIYNASLNLAGSLEKYDYNISSYVGGSMSLQQVGPLNSDGSSNQAYVGQSTTTVRGVIRPHGIINSEILGRITPSLTLGYGNLWNSATNTSPVDYYQTLGFNFFRGKSGNGPCGVTLDGNMGFTTTASGNTGAILRIRPTYITNWLGGSASFSYSLNLQGGETDTVSSPDKHQLGTTVFLYLGDRLNFTTNALYGLDDSRITLFTDASYRVTKDWQFHVNHTLIHFPVSGGQPYESSYLKIGLYKTVGPYDIGLAWSPNGANYGIDTNTHYWLEIGSRGF